MLGKKGVGHMVVHYKWNIEDAEWDIVEFGKESSAVGGYMDLAHRSWALIHGSYKMPCQDRKESDNDEVQNQMISQRDKGEAHLGHSNWFEKQHCLP